MDRFLGLKRRNEESTKNMKSMSDMKDTKSLSGQLKETHPNSSLTQLPVRGGMNGKILGRGMMLLLSLRSSPLCSGLMEVSSGTNHLVLISLSTELNHRRKQTPCLPVVVEREGDPFLVAVLHPTRLSKSIVVQQGLVGPVFVWNFVAIPSRHV